MIDRRRYNLRELLAIFFGARAWAKGNHDSRMRWGRRS